MIPQELDYEIVYCSRNFTTFNKVVYGTTLVLMFQNDKLIHAFVKAKDIRNQEEIDELQIAYNVLKSDLKEMGKINICMN